MTAARPDVLTVVGARPQFIKAAPVCRALSELSMSEVLVHTGQHFDPLMSEVFFRELDIPRPACNLEVAGLGHGAMTGRMLERLEKTLVETAPRLVLVYGDTNSTLAGALAAAKLHIPVAHVEAGLRSFNRTMPEEINRVVVDHLSSLLFCPSATAVANLTAEGISAGVHVVGDVMYDTTLAAIREARESCTILATLALEPGAYAVATVHRAENTEDMDRFSAIMAWLERAGSRTPVIWPVHPRTRRLIDTTGSCPKGVRLIEPLGYLDMTWLVHHAAAVYTDSGGLQKEAYFHRVPCVTLRDETEWVETIEAGWNRLWTVPDYAPRREISDYGDGTAAQQIARSLRNHLSSTSATICPTIARR
jgi:UDP-GlcNAc3NAcA epimerase